MLYNLARENKKKKVPAAIAAQAMTNIMENLNGIVGIGLITVFVRRVM